MGPDGTEITFGVILPIGRRLELLAIEPPTLKWETTVATAARAEGLGYDSVWVYDHLHNVPVPSHETVFECWTTLAAVSQRTEQVRLGHLVGNNLFRPPALVAKMAATVDVMSGGRLEWGIGTGWDRGELEAYGYELPPPAQRIDMLAEAVQLVRALWTQPDVDHEGRFYRARGAHCEAVGRDPGSIVRTWSHDAYLVEDEAELDAAPAALWGESPDAWRAANLVGTPKRVAERIHEYVEHGCRGFVIWCADAPNPRTLQLFAEQVIPEFR
jgi:alkanesulfonate monooxygenase SsuD/methylene tetrahydromethanopterin reductase-like flavin-dependent oxidoreductase (luciferase family)